MTTSPRERSRIVRAMSPFIRMTAFRYCSGSTRVRSAHASSTLSHFGRKRTGAGVSASGRGALGTSRSSRPFSSRKRIRGSGRSRARPISGTCIMLQATMSRSDAGPNAARYRRRISARASRGSCAAGPHQSEKDPIGVGGMKLFDWQFALEAWRRLTGQEGGESNASTPVFQEALSNYGAVVMGRNMFGGGPGPWSADRPWSGWWGDEPPYQTAVFVLTHHARDPWSMNGRDTFFFRPDVSA